MRKFTIHLVALAFLVLGWGGSATPAAAQEAQLLTPASNSGVCLTVPGADPADGTALQVTPCTGAANQQFVLARDGAWKALAGAGRARDGREMCVDHWPDNHAGGAVKVWPCRPSMQNDPQRWRRTTEGQYVSDARMCMEVRGTQVVVNACSVVAVQTLQARTVGRPAITRIDQGPWPVGGTLIVAGENLAAGTIGIALHPRDYNRNSTSYTGDRRIASRTAGEVRIDLSGVPAGSYTLALEIFDTSGREVLRRESPVVIGAPSVLGPPVVRQVGPHPATMGSTLYLDGESFAENVEVHLVAAGGARRTLPRGAAGVTFSRIHVTLPTDLQPGSYRVLAVNPTQSTSSAAHELLVLRAGQTAEGWAQEQRAAAEAEAIRRAHAEEQARLAAEARAAAAAGGRGARGAATRGEAARGGNIGDAPAEAGAPEAAGGDFQVAIVTATGMCLIPTADQPEAIVHVRPCPEGGAMYRIENGYVVTAGGNCITPGGEGSVPLRLRRCHGGRADGTVQQWYFHGNKLAQNAARSNLCMDVEGGSRRAGARVIWYECRNYQTPAENQRFSLGGAFRLGIWALASMPPNARDAVQGQNGAALFSNGTMVIAAGGGNVIAAGGGNVIAAGGGNVIAPGGGNVIAPGGGNVIAPGGGNVIAPGGGNVIAPGGGNLRIVNDPSLLIQGASVIASGGNNVIASGALNFTGQSRRN
jgi:hypothetical protein